MDLLPQDDGKTRKYGNAWRTLWGVGLLGLVETIVHWKLLTSEGSRFYVARSCYSPRWLFHIFAQYDCNFSWIYNGDPYQRSASELNVSCVISLLGSKWRNMFFLLRYLSLCDFISKRFLEGMDHGLKWWGRLTGEFSDSKTIRMGVRWISRFCSVYS